MRVAWQELSNSHVCNIRVLLIVISDRQEIGIHRFNIPTTSFGEHRLQCHEPLCVPLEREQLGVTIDELPCGRNTDELWVGGSADLSFIPQQGAEVSCLVSWGRRRIKKVSARFMDVLC